jgi:hypothetical protein
METSDAVKSCKNKTASTTTTSKDRSVAKIIIGLMGALEARSGGNVVE